MNVHITNLAKVVDINFVLDGLTVIAGRNATGKSSISRALMTYFTLVRRLEDHIRDARVDGIGKIIGENLWTDGSRSWLTRSGRWLRYLSEDENALSHEFWNDSSRVTRLILRLLRQDVRGHRFAQENTTAREIESGGGLEDKVQKVQGAALRILNTADSEYEEFAFRTTFNKVFCGQLTSMLAPTIPTVIVITADEGECKISFPPNGLVTLPGRYIAGFRMVSYMEPMHILDIIGAEEKYEDTEELIDRYDAESGTWPRMLHKRRYDSRLSFEDDRDIRKNQAVLGRIENILHGRLVESEGNIKFKEDSFSEPIELKNLASGAKSIAIVLKALENGSLREGDLFIIDEPESNLHPAWQVWFAELLILIQKELDIKLLINTHSPYFLKALEVFSKKYGIFESAHYYFLEATSDSGATGREITSDLSEAYESLYTPLARLMEI